MQYNSPLFYLIQPLWRDEAFSVLLSYYSPADIVMLTSGDFTPPLYYIALHYWMLVFGTSEMPVRLLSTAFFVVMVYMVYLLSGELTGHSKKTKFRLYATVLTAINPMLLYFAFEARAYSLMALLAVCSMYFFLKQKWLYYAICTLLGLYTHPFIAFLMVVQGLCIALSRNWSVLRAYIISAVALTVLYIPWLIAIYFQIKRGGSMWFYPVDLNLVGAVIGNFYLGFEGTPGWFWRYSKYVALIIITIALLGIYSPVMNRTRKMMVYMWFFIPLILVLILSYFKVIYVMRYLLFIVPAEVLFICLAIAGIHKKWVQYGVFGVVCIATVWFNCWYAPYHAKTDYRRLFIEINQEIQDEDIILTDTSLPFFESQYYAKNSKQVYFYNPNHQVLPAYVGAVLIPESQWKYEIPAGTSYIIYENGTYEKITR